MLPAGQESHLTPLGPLGQEVQLCLAQRWPGTILNCQCIFCCGHKRIIELTESAGNLRGKFLQGWRGKPGSVVQVQTEPIHPPGEQWLFAAHLLPSLPSPGYPWCPLQGALHLWTPSLKCQGSSRAKSKDQKIPPACDPRDGICPAMKASPGWPSRSAPGRVVGQRRAQTQQTRLSTAWHSHDQWSVIHGSSDVLPGP